MASEQKERMRGGGLYRPADPELVADRMRARELTDRFNATGPQQIELRRELLRTLCGRFGDGATVMPPLRCDYGYQIEIGANAFVNYEAIMLDCAPIRIGDDAQIGPRCQFLTPLHPMDDHDLRRQGWESASAITVGNNVWFGGGVIVCAGVTIGDDVVVGAGSVVTRDLPSRVFAAGSPARVIRPL